MQNIFPRMSFSRGRRAAPGKNNQRGQSLVELALTTPILLLIMAGTLEVTNLLTMFNELQAATREAGRLASQGAPDSNLWDVFVQATEKTRIRPYTTADYNDMNVWVIRPSIAGCVPPDKDPAVPSLCNSGWKNGSPTNWGVTPACITPNPPGCTMTVPLTPKVVWDELGQASANDYTGFSNTTFAIVVVAYNAPTMLNLRLNLFGAQFGRADGKFPVNTNIVFRQEVSSQSANQLANGCSVYPIAINFESIPPVDRVDGGDNFDLNYSTDFSFLAWQKDGVASGVAANWLTKGTPTVPNQPNGSLVMPGTSQSGIPNGNTNNYINPFDQTDTQLRRGGWVLGTQGVTASTSQIQTELTNHKNAKRTLRVITYEKDKATATAELPTPPTASVGGDPVNHLNPGPDVNVATYWTNTLPINNPVSNLQFYQIDDFLVVQVMGVAGNVVTFKWVSDQQSCGYPQ